MLDSVHGPHWVCRARPVRRQRGHSGILCAFIGLSLMLLSVRAVRDREPAQPELPQELGGPPAGPVLLALHPRGPYKHEKAGPAGRLPEEPFLRARAA